MWVSHVQILTQSTDSREKIGDRQYTKPQGHFALVIVGVRTLRELPVWHPSRRSLLSVIAVD